MGRSTVLGTWDEVPILRSLTNLYVGPDLRVCSASTSVSWPRTQGIGSKSKNLEGFPRCGKVCIAQAFMLILLGRTFL